MAIPQSLTRPALPGAVNREGAVYSPLTLTCFFFELLSLIVFWRFALVEGSVGAKMVDRHTGPHGGQQRVFLPLPLPYSARGGKIAHRATRGATGAASLRLLRGGGITGVQGAAPPAKQADGVKPDALLASLGSDKTGNFAWLSAAQEAIFGSHWSFKYSELQLFLIYPLRLSKYPPVHHEPPGNVRAPSLFRQPFCLGSAKNCSMVAVVCQANRNLAYLTADATKISLTTARTSDKIICG